MLNITSNFLIYKYQTDDVQYFTVDIQKFIGDLIYKPPFGLGSHGTKNVQTVGSKVLNISHVDMCKFSNLQKMYSW